MLGWKKEIENTYGFDPNYFIYEDSGEIQGIFPSFRINNLFSGKSQISLPFSSYGGPISIDSNISDKLIKYFWDTAIKGIESKNAITLAFDKSRINDRKQWLIDYNKNNIN